MGAIIFLIIAFVVFIIILSVIRNAKAGARRMQGNSPMRHGGGINRGMNRRRVSYGGRTFYIYIGDDGYYYDENGYVIEDPEFGETDFIDNDADSDYDDGYDDSDSSKDYGDNS